MPLNVTGVKELQKDLKDLDPALNKEFIKEIALRGLGINLFKRQ
jgi:hypothetical protein